LISTFAPASSSFFFMASESALLNAFLHERGHALDEIFGFLQAQTLISRITLIYGYLLVRRVFLEGDGEFRLLLNRSSGRGGRARGSGYRAAAVTPNSSPYRR